MIVEKFFINLFVENPAVAWTLITLAVIALTEFFVVFFAKHEKVRGNLIALTTLIKIGAFACAIASLGVIFMLIGITFVMFEALFTYWRGILMTVGVFGFIVIFIWLNTYLVKKNAKEAKHEHNFKKGDKLVLKPELGTKDALSDNTGKPGIWEIYKADVYEFLGNKRYDAIELKCISSSAGKWQGYKIIARENIFRKKRK